jgi:hypothetical protein
MNHTPLDRAHRVALDTLSFKIDTRVLVNVKEEYVFAAGIYWVSGFS